MLSGFFYLEGDEAALALGDGYRVVVVEGIPAWEVGLLHCDVCGFDIGFK